MTGLSADRYLENIHLVSIKSDGTYVYTPYLPGEVGR